ncbi:uncharacterized protein (DUF1800 family) [Inhella inkyongensis]|uniref:Uncharacterized protein (DUF1800 family) n=1 Tax=Inhella inkyongensis TaxID=392593 RepID=A0A840S913_9BURK|nr:DUF1800 domain-containing protein [Inhella inkyongensis]MBB5206018.1 uncharacterized protein (DUF1800 family) [Inhella inkyongensis]
MDAETTLIAPPLPPQALLDSAPREGSPLLVLGASALLSACGGGGGDSPAPTPAPPPPPPPPPAPPTAAQAARFLAQASFSASAAEIAAVQSKGYAGWLDEQLALAPVAPTRYDWMVANGYAVEANRDSFAGSDNAIWAKLIGSPDPVRQRMTLALSEILVVSMLGLPITWRGLAIAHYTDILERHAFGSFRSLLQDVSVSVAMGSYLNMLGNKKEDTRTGRVPDENYAREVMQLFTIGLYQLNADGTIRTGSDGKPLESYTQADITQLARVFTGWDRDRVDAADFGYAAKPMKHVASNFSTGDKTVLGTTISASLGGPEALSQALDLLFNHANVGPFIGRQLIQRFTQSHPSAAYVARVAAVFNNNGQGQRGDLKAVLRAVLLDPEARPAAPGPSAGRLREPVQRFVQWARSFGVTSKAGRWPVGDLSSPSTRLGQSPMRSPSVFNFFRPGYVPPGNELASNAITAPEFQLVNESTVAGYLNYMQGVISSGISSGDVAADYTTELALAGDAQALLDSLNLRLAAGALDSNTVTTLKTALESISATTDTGKLNRVRAAILLVMAAPAYLVQQ